MSQIVSREGVSCVQWPWKKIHQNYTTPDTPPLPLDSPGIFKVNKRYKAIILEYLEENQQLQRYPTVGK
jgi:hypothetical protein